MIPLAKSESLGEAIRNATLTFPHQIALIETDRERLNAQFTFAELKFAAERFGALLQEKGLKPGDRVAILMTNQSKWLISAIAVLWSGVTLVPIDYKLSPAEQIALISHSQVDYIIVEYFIYSKLKSDLKIPAFVTEAPPSAPLQNAFRWEDSTTTSFQYFDQNRNDVACVVYSSGTGGRPKGCMLTHDNYLSQAEELAKLYPMEKDDRYFSILPTNHAIDFMCGFFLPLHFGGTIVHQRTLRPEFIAHTMRNYGITHMALVPMILKSLQEKIQQNLHSQSPFKKKMVKLFPALLRKRVLKQFGGKLKYFFAGGAFVDPMTAQFFYDLGIPVVIGYGLTEACTVLTVNDLKPFRADTVGKPLPNIQIKIDHPNDQEIGEVWAKGPTIMKGYFNDPELTQEMLKEGWLKTGDLGMLDSSGHLKLVGRAKNMIVTEGGKNVYPEDVETYFSGLHASQEYCVFAANYVWPVTGFKGDELILVVRPTSQEAIDKLISDLKEKNRRLSDYKRLTGYLVWNEEFPKTASLKVKRNLLAEQISKTTTREAGLKELS